MTTEIARGIGVLGSDEIIYLKAPETCRGIYERDREEQGKRAVGR